jgi:hypothetical protein
MNVSGLLKKLFILSVLVTLILSSACSNVQPSPASTTPSASPTAEVTPTLTPYVELPQITPTNSPPASPTVIPVPATRISPTPTTNVTPTPKRTYTSEEQAAIKEATNRMGNAITNAVWCMEDSLPKNPTLTSVMTARISIMKNPDLQNNIVSNDFFVETLFLRLIRDKYL